MLKRLIAFSIQNALLVLLAAVAVLGLGVYQLQHMPVDVFPELNAPTVIILTEAGGLSADEVEQYVTFPIESGLNGLSGVRRVRSGSAISLSVVYVEFDWGTDIYRARQQVGERLVAAEERLPKNVHVEIAPITGITGEIMLLSLAATKPSVTDTDLRAHAEYDLTNRLQSVPGVAMVVSIGGELPEYQVNVRQDELRLYGLTTDDVVAAARKAHSADSAGYLPNVGGLELPVRQSARVRSVDDIKATIVKYHQGKPVTIGQVAEVVMAGAPKRGTASEGGRPAVVLSVQKSPGANTLQLTADIDKALDAAEAGVPDGMQLNRFVMRQANFINISLQNVLHVLRDAAILVTIVVILFLLNIRTAIITLTALPLSLAVALLALSALGLSINVMTLGGLAVAIGELVDDAIIDVENVFRRLRENAALPELQRKSFTRVIFDASNEIRSAVVFATVIIVIVFIPLLFLQGIEGRFFRPLGIAYITSILASLVVALTVTPAMCRYLLRGKLARHADREGFLVRWLKAAYAPTLRAVLGARWLVLGVAVVMTGLSLWLANTFGTEFLPRFNEGTITVFLTAPPGTSLVESNRLAAAVDVQMMQVPGVRSVVRRTGRAERDAHAEPPNRSEIELSLNPGVRRQDVLPELDKVLARIPGIGAETGQPMEHRLSHILSGTPAAIAISVYGEDLPKLRQAAAEVEQALRAIPGTRDVTGNREATVISLPIKYRHEDLARYGLTPAEAASQVKQALAGEIVAEVNDGFRRYDLTVRLHPDERRGVEDVGQLILHGQGGALVRLNEVADLGREHAPMGITRENARRKAVISTNVADGYNLGHLVEQVKAKVDPIVARYGYAIVYGGQFEAQQSAARTIYLMGAGVLVVILVLLYIALGTFRAALLVMVNLPLALVGGVVAVYLTESRSILGNTLALFGGGDARYQAPVISIASMVGFVTLFGIAVRNGILMVDHYRNLQREGKSVHDSIVQGSMERLVPILMTALAAVLGLVPLAIAGGEPGSELLAPLAVVVLGGLVTSTLLNLVVVPAGYALVFRDSQSPKARNWAYESRENLLSEPVASH
ncbi:efflux RND transporter permease subunit [Humisphaera borealis]|uniref:Efflux RND transporter permease subunit n=1 Tax=Humisphaera borealis TaxID=2807512 RepID=A0A7M2WZ81_9BACT|nr:efflux RND transporter permease subunit [Humisphaera borealis]QOV90693.1 efflux RND transporter permease subunit [Humisphaera borealis]